MPPARRIVTVHLFALSLVAALQAQPGPPSLPTLESLGAAWNGSSAAPQCDVDTASSVARVASEVCVWRRSRESWTPYELAGHKQSGHPLAELTWATSVSDSAQALAFRDSVGRTLQRYPLRTHECPDSGRFWQAAGLYVHFSLGGRQPSGRVNVTVFATTFPAVPITRLLCPGIPIIPPSSAVPPGRLGTALHRRDAGSPVPGADTDERRGNAPSRRGWREVTR